MAACRREQRVAAAGTRARRSRPRRSVPGAALARSATAVMSARRSASLSGGTSGMSPSSEPVSSWTMRRDPRPRANVAPALRCDANEVGLTLPRDSGSRARRGRGARSRCRASIGSTIGPAQASSRWVRSAPDPRVLSVVVCCGWDHLQLELTSIWREQLFDLVGHPLRDDQRAQPRRAACSAL